MSTDATAPAVAVACPEPGELLLSRVGEVRAWLAGLDAADLGDRDRIALVAALEELTSSAAGAQARMTAAYASSQRALGCSARGVAAEVGLARRVGLPRASRLVAAARVLVEDLPETLALLESGRLSEDRAVVVAGQVAHLEPAARQEVDDLLSEDLPRLGDAEVRDAVDAAITSIDPAAVEARRAAAGRQRRVTVRPGADGMAWLSIHTTAVEAAAALNTLHAHADSVLAGTGGLSDLPETPDGRSHAEVMADAAVSRLTGRTCHEGPPVEVQLVMTDTALFHDDDTDDGDGPGTGRPGSGRPGNNNDGPGGGGVFGGGSFGRPATGGSPARGGSRDAVARVVGAGPIPAGVARDLIRHTPPVPAANVPEATAPSGSGPWRMFEGPDWDFDDRTPDQHARDGAADLARWVRDQREAVRVTLRRVHTSPDGRNPVAIDARRRPMPLAVRTGLGAGGGSRGSGPGPTATPDLDIAAWLARLRAPARPDELATPTSPDRCARGVLRLLVVLRDQRCRVPWCTAPIRHLDHVTPHRDGGTTSLTGLTGDCVGHNHAKEDPGHTVEVTHDGTSAQPHTIRWTTPTGHTYDGTAPPILGWGTTPDNTTDTHDTDADRLAPDEASPLEAQLAALLAA